MSPSWSTSGVAMFDLDRALCSEPAAELFGHALDDAGLRQRRYEGRRPAWLDGAVEALANTALGVRLAGAGAAELGGIEVGSFEEAGRVAASELSSCLRPWAGAEIGRQQARGRAIVLVSAAPRVVAEPLGALLGADAVIATRLEVSDGRLTGLLDGEIVWGPARARAVTSWLDRADVDHASAAFYGASINDRHAMGAVGEPVAASPDPCLTALAHLRGWRTMGPPTEISFASPIRSG